MVPRTYGALAPELDAAGFAVPALASLPHISVAGAVATATHGSGDGTRSLAGAVVGLEIIGADGELRWVRARRAGLPRLGRALSARSAW